MPRASNHEEQVIAAFDDMVCWPVSARVGNVKNNDASLIEPIVLQ
jgi:hypothetical protein